MSRNPIAPGNHDKAWNDPPQLSFNATSQSSSNRLKMMKKRIPVPLNSSGITNPAVVPSQKLNNPPPMQVPPTKDICIEEKFADINLFEDVTPFNEEKLAESLEILINKVFNEFPDPKNSSKEDVKKRTDVLEEMWTKNQLNSQVRKRMTQLINALNKDNYEIAWSLHQSLIVDYTAECSMWMSGIKTLIVEGRNLNSRNQSQDSKIPEVRNQDQLPLFLNPETGKQ